MEERSSMVEAFALKMLAGGIRVHGGNGTPVESRHERQAQRYVRYFVRERSGLKLQG
jgi:hypothetical protein